ncbi:GNAT family N-acetyltransferase [Planctomyces sp. SH-PL14]|uniref:GNAT family N-acetyltransferase n=1 Tax=Planctomyces sp. SH-PL14 TaxID=1632864 RepID=UPI0009462EC0|nr:GNAT family N-acetyltransferase [Planctomyces sp. SH-PL14]
MDDGTGSIQLVPHTREGLLAMVAAMDPADRAQVSPDWLARVQATEVPDPWVFGFQAVLRETGVAVGTGGFRTPPTDGSVEIAYGIDAEYRGQGYATETAAGLTRFALASGRVTTVFAHTLPEPNASTRVLTKCGFRKTGDVIDPEDGLVWRWEYVPDAVG